MEHLKIRAAVSSDRVAIWNILKPIIRSGLYYHGFSPGMSAEQMMDFWFTPSYQTFIAGTDHALVGSYILRPLPFANDEIANCARGTAQDFEGRGVGNAMCKHSLKTARRLGYRAMRFTQVISTNVRAVALWKRNGFKIVGLAPQSFLHPAVGRVEMYVMHRDL